MYILKVPENPDRAFREIQDGRQDGHLILMTIHRQPSWTPPWIGKALNVHPYCLRVV